MPSNVAEPMTKGKLLSDEELGLLLGSKEGGITFTWVKKLRDHTTYLESENAELKSHADELEHSYTEAHEKMVDYLELKTKLQEAEAENQRLGSDLYDLEQKYNKLAGNQ